MSAPTVTSAALTGAFELCRVDVSADERVLTLPGGGPWLAVDARLEGKTGRHVQVIGPRGGIRSWWLVDGVLWVWGPVYTGLWPELDAEVARALGVRPLAFHLEGNMPVFAQPPQIPDSTRGQLALWGLL